MAGRPAAKRARSRPCHSPRCCSANSGTERSGGVASFWSEVSAPPEGLSGVASATEMAADPNGTLRQHACNALEDNVVAAIAGEVGLPINLPAVGPHGGMADPPPPRARQRTHVGLIRLCHADLSFAALLGSLSSNTGRAARP